MKKVWDSITAFLAVVLVVAVIVMVILKIPVPQEMWILATAAVMSYFSKNNTAITKH